MSIISLLKILSDENRLRMLNITKEDALCVGEIQTILDLSQSNTSRHLEKIKSSGMVTYHKKAQWIIYQLSNESLETYPFIKQLLFEDIIDIPLFKKDLIRLNKYKASGLTCQDLKDANFDYNKIKFTD
ncbi:MAG: winged helix-turn-helix transcriptional regulator [Candidatus Atribacteria bacterium]|nr:winged helix-turn-helix transcriptional regulator [Candidatus Atribacteria bacterium]